MKNYIVDVRISADDWQEYAVIAANDGTAREMAIMMARDDFALPAAPLTNIQER